jgi:hypothetical protein
VIVTLEPCFASVPPVGSWLSTIPTRPGSFTSCGCTWTVKPADSSVERAEASSWLVTSGTLEVFGPFETLSSIVAPFWAWPLGLWSTTVSFGWLLSTSVRLTPNPCCWSVALAWSKVRPITDGTSTWAGPDE